MAEGPPQRPLGAYTRGPQLPQEDPARVGRAWLLDTLPMERLTADAQRQISQIAQRPTLHRQLGKQSIDCDRDLFLHVVRNPEILVGIWELMEITQVQTRRLDSYQLRAVDGAGTQCTIDLVYGDPSLHIYVAEGFYDGKLTAGAVHGKGLFILRCDYRTDALGNTVIDGSLDCFLQVEQLAADLIVRTFGPLIGRTADHNFAETAKFINQLGVNARSNPDGLEDLALRLPQVPDLTRQRFAALVRQSAQRQRVRQLYRVVPTAAKPTDSP